MNAEACPGVIVYSSPWCPYCLRATALLNKKGIAFTEIRVDNDPSLRAEMQQRSGRTSVPQIFIGDQHVGGSDDLAAMSKDGRLDSLLTSQD